MLKHASRGGGEGGAFSSFCNSFVAVFVKVPDCPLLCTHGNQSLSNFHFSGENKQNIYAKQNACSKNLSLY